MIIQVTKCASVGDSLQPFMQAEKREAKEAVRQEQVIADQPQQQSVQPLECDATTHLVKAKNAAARKLMEIPKTKLRMSKSKTVIQQRNNCTTSTTESNKKDGLKKSRSNKAVTTKALAQKARKKQKGHRNKEHQVTPILPPMPKHVKPGGCLHCDLSELLSFTKSGAKWYMVPNRFLAGRHCTDCHTPVEQIVPKKPSTTMVFYCDQGIKGFDAPDDDPMKTALTCNLVLCPQCESNCRIKFYTENTSGRGGRRQSRRR
jgi:hypothetical protein